MIISIHQPETYPQISFFEKIQRSDLFVILDNVQFRKNYFQNRNVITDDQGKMHYLTIPVSKKSDLIFQKEILDVDIASKHYSKIKNIKNKSPYIGELKEFFSNDVRHNQIVAYNMDFINWTCRRLGIKTKIEYSSNLKIEQKKSKLILEICKNLNATQYYSGISGGDYLDREEFEKQEVEILFQDSMKIYEEVEKYGKNRHSSMIELIVDIGFDRISKILEKVA